MRHLWGEGHMQIYTGWPIAHAVTHAGIHSGFSSGASTWSCLPWGSTYISSWKDKISRWVELRLRFEHSELIFICLHLLQCWENRLGREMYKLCIFNFLASFCNAFLLSYPRKWVFLINTFFLLLIVVWMERSIFSWLTSVDFTEVWSCERLKLSFLRMSFLLPDRLVQERYPTFFLARLSGKQHFLIPFNVLDLVYSQTVSWVGVYYCPLLPLIGTVTLMATFYIRKVTWMNNLSYTRCSSSQIAPY